MCYDNQLFSFYRDAENEGMAITILGPRVPVQNSLHQPNIGKETGMQTERSHIMVDKEAATRDRERVREIDEYYQNFDVRVIEQENIRIERELARRKRERERATYRYSNNLDVRYMSSLKNLKDRLLSAYSCNQYQCPMIRERMLNHQQSIHGRRLCEKGCSLAASKTKNCVSIKAGPDFDQFLGPKKCAECPTSTYKTNSKNKCKNFGVSRSGHYHDNCSKSPSDVKPIKANLRNEEKKCTDGCSSPFDNTSTKAKKCTDGCSSPFDKTLTMTNKKRFETTTSTSNRTERYLDATPSYSNRYNNIDCDRYNAPASNYCTDRYSGGRDYCLISENPKYNVVNDSCERTPYDECNDTLQYIRASRYVDVCTEPGDISVSCPSQRQYSDACATTYSTSCTGNIEAPKFARIPTNEDTQNAYCKLDNANLPTTSKNGNDLPFILRSANDSNACEMQVDTTQKPLAVDEATGSDSKMSLTGESKAKKSKITKGFKQPYYRNTVESSTSYKLTPPYAVDRSSSDRSDASLKSGKSRRTSNPIYREVKEWIREVPLYPGLGKQAKEENKQIINKLISNLYSLASEAGSKEYDYKIKSEIDACLNKIPIWYPGAKREQIGFKKNLVDRLHQRLKGLSRRNSRSRRRSNKNTVTEVRASLLSCDQSFNSHVEAKDVEIRICVIDWLRSIYIRTKFYDEVELMVAQLADFVIIRIKPVLNQEMSRNNHKAVLKTAILNIMKDFPIVICSKSGSTHIQYLAEQLTNKLLAINSSYTSELKTLDFPMSSMCCNQCHSNLDASYNPKQMAICCEIRKCFEDASVECNDMVIQEAGIILCGCHEIPDPEGKRQARNEIINLLVTSTNLSEDQACQLAKLIMRNVRKALSERHACEGSHTSAQRRFPDTVSVYTSMEGSINTQHVNTISVNTSMEYVSGPIRYPATSTPKKKRVKKDVPILNSQEIKYMEEVSKIIRPWLNTLPETFNAPEEQGFKEMIIKELAGDITDGLKVEQLAGARYNRRDVLQHIVCRWMYRLGAFEVPLAVEQIYSFLDKLEQIPVPVLTQPQHGNRQAMASVKFTEAKGTKWGDNFIPKGSDILEDQISVWMNEQPSDIFTDIDKKSRQDKIHDLAQILENNLGNKRPPPAVSRDIAQWLNQLVRPEKIPEIGLLAEDLKDRVISLPQDETLTTNMEKRIKEREEKLKLMSEMANAPKTHIEEIKNEGSPEQENTMSIFISNFIEHHYDVEDPLARRAFNRLLNSHLLRLSLPARKEVYQNFEKKELDEHFPPRNMLRELEYIKDISDWLKNLPVDASYNTLGNRDRTDFVNSLAISIREIEEDREKDPNAMDFNMYMFVMILEHLKLLPLPKDYHPNAPFMVEQLFRRIIAHREYVAGSVSANESINTTGVNADNIGDFIEEFIRINGVAVAHDEVKMEAWATRLIREIKKLVQNTSQTPTLSKAQVYDKLTNVPVPGDETVNYFNLELDYVIEITNWMKNLPLLPMSEAEKNSVTDKICELAEKVTEADRKTVSYPKDKENINNELKGYIQKWISELPLDRQQNIVFPMATEQLMNRIEKAKRNDVSTEVTISQSNKAINSTSKRSLSSIFKGKKNKTVTPNDLVDIIEKWCQALPIKAQNIDVAKDMRNDISRKICQKVAELNMNPSVYNNDIFYKDMLRDEIDTIFESMPPNAELKNKKDKLKTDLVHQIVELKNEYKEKTAGDIYKQTLEKTINASIPDPVPCNQVYDPGFEIYKDRLATMFILENFDHGTDAVKTKHEQLLKKEINKYFDHANNRNSVPLSKEQLYNELYSNLFKVPVPNEASVIDEVEKLKTRCEIDAWFEELPIREANGLNELLDWDNILSLLAARIHDIEVIESKPDDKILKEIMKWLPKLPLQPGKENKTKEFATTLQKKLKSTSGQRKCVLGNSKKGKKERAKRKNKESRQNSDTNQLTSLPQTEILLERRKPKINTVDKLYDIIQQWCNELPISAEEQQHVQGIKDNLGTQIFVKISDLNSNPEIFSDDVIYDEVLSEEIEKLLSTVPSNLGPIKTNRIDKLKQAIKSLKPLIEEEKAAHQFKQDLNNIVDKVLEKPQIITSQEKAVFLDAVKNDIINEFIQYKYSDDKEEEKQCQKTNIQDKISTYIKCQEGKKQGAENQKDFKNDTLMKTNQLIAELSKVSPQSNSIVRDEIEEIRMKKQISELFNKIRIPDKKDDKFKVNYMKDSLAKKLNQIELNGHTAENEKKMMKEIEKCLNKLGKEANSAVIDSFVSKLKDNEIARRLPQNELTKTPDSLENYCRRVCDMGNQNPRIGCPNPPPLNIPKMPANFAKSIAFNPRNRYSIFEDKHANLVRKNVNNNYINRATYASSGEDEDGRSSDEENTKCLCLKKSGSKKRKPYCMVPMRYCYDGFDGYLNSLWCRMPLPGYF